LVGHGSELTNEMQTDGWMDGPTDGESHGRMDGRMDGWIQIEKGKNEAKRQKWTE